MTDVCPLWWPIERQGRIVFRIVAEIVSSPAWLSHDCHMIVTVIDAVTTDRYVALSIWPLTAHPATCLQLTWPQQHARTCIHAHTNTHTRTQARAHTSHAYSNNSNTQSAPGGLLLLAFLWSNLLRFFCSHATNPLLPPCTIRNILPTPSNLSLCSIRFLYLTHKA